MICTVLLALATLAQQRLVVLAAGNSGAAPPGQGEEETDAALASKTDARA